jgi:hypothetical protein
MNEHEWIKALRDRLPMHIHPGARMRCSELIQAMQPAANEGDWAKVALLAQLVQSTIDSEVEWEDDKALSAIDRTYIPRCCRG